MIAAGSHRQIRWSSEGGPREQSQATVTLADALIAQTGSIFVSASGGGRGASVVAPTHIVYAFAKQLVPDLVTALRNATADGRIDKNSYACVISGSSRTADIEKILVQGAHGPMRLVVIVENNSELAGFLCTKKGKWRGLSHASRAASSAWECHFRKRAAGGLERSDRNIW